MITRRCLINAIPRTQPRNSDFLRKENSNRRLTNGRRYLCVLFLRSRTPDLRVLFKFSSRQVDVFERKKKKKTWNFAFAWSVQLLWLIFDQSFGIFSDTCENRWMFVCRAIICYGTSRFCRLRYFDNSCKFSFFGIHSRN